MAGKILKVASNDLYGNVEDREVVVFASFIHVKYMNRYVIFTNKDEYDKNKLYYGSVHLKDDSLVSFSVRNEVVKYIEEFLEQYLSGNINKDEYEIIDIENVKKIELVSYNEMECRELNKLDELSIKRVVSTSEDMVSEKKPVLLYIILSILLLLLVGVTYLYLRPNDFLVEYKELNCNKELVNNEINMIYTENMLVKFDKKDMVSSMLVTDSYVFNNGDKYFEFKENDRHYEYFDIDGTYKYNDNDLELRIMYDGKTIINEYNEMLSYLKSEGYECVEGKYYE